MTCAATNGTATLAVKVSCPDPQLEDVVGVRCTPQETPRGGVLVVRFRDADGGAIEAILTPVLATALRAALALADLPGAGVVCL